MGWRLFHLNDVQLYLLRGTRFLLSSAGDFMGTWLSPQFCRGNAGIANRCPGCSSVRWRGKWSGCWSMVGARNWGILLILGLLLQLALGLPLTAPSHSQFPASTKALLGCENPSQTTNIQTQGAQAWPHPPQCPGFFFASQTPDWHQELEIPV